MVKIVRLEPIAEEAVVQTNANILSALLAKELMCFREVWRDMCYYVYIKDGMESLSPLVAERSGL